MPTLTLEVTIRLSVERDDYGNTTDEYICDFLERHPHNINDHAWNAVHVRVAPTEETPANG